MNRSHTQQPQHYIHHKRASVARKLACLLARAVKRLRLHWNDYQMQLAADHAADLVSMSEALPKDIRRMHLVMVQLEEKRMRIERGLS